MWSRLSNWSKPKFFGNFRLNWETHQTADQSRGKILLESHWELIKKLPAAKTTANLSRHSIKNLKTFFSSKREIECHNPYHPSICRESFCVAMLFTTKITGSTDCCNEYEDVSYWRRLLFNSLNAAKTAETIFHSSNRVIIVSKMFTSFSFYSVLTSDFKIYFSFN